MAIKLNTLIQVRRADFTANGSFVLQAGEPGYCTSEKVFKIGDGSTTWAELGFANKAEVEALIATAKGEIKTTTDALEGRLDTAEGEIDALQAADTAIRSEFANADAAILSNAQTYTDGKIADLDASLKAYADTAEADAIDAVVGGSEDAATANTIAGAKKYADAAAAAAEEAAKSEAKTATDALGARLTTAEGEIDALQEKLADVTNVMDFRGAVEALPAVDGYQNGDVIVVTAGENAGKEFVLSDGAWVEFGSTSAADTAIAQLQEDVEKLEAEFATDGRVTKAEAAITDHTTAIDALEAALAEGGTTANAIAAAKAAADAAQADIDAHVADKDNPHGVTKEQVGLGNVENKSTATIKTEFTGDVAEGDDGFVTGGAVAAAIATAKTEAIEAAATDATNKADAAQAAAIASAKEYTDEQIEAVNAKAGVSSITAGTDIVVTKDADDESKVTVAHAAYTTGTLKDATHDSATDPSFLTSISFTNGHITGATVQNLAAVLGNMEFILDGGTV